MPSSRVRFRAGRVPAPCARERRRKLDRIIRAMATRASRPRDIIYTTLEKHDSPASKRYGGVKKSYTGGDDRIKIHSSCALFAQHPRTTSRRRDSEYQPP